MNLQVNSITNGTVIDHLKSGTVFQVIKILNLENYNDVLLIGSNLKSNISSTKIKDILKIQNRFLNEKEYNKLALISRNTTINIIKNEKIIEKKQVHLTSNIEGILKCPNPKCVTNHEPIKTKFIIINKEKLNLNCYYCEKLFEKDDIKFL